MQIPSQLFIAVPWWAWCLLGLLVWCGIRARRAGVTSLARLAIPSMIFGLWGLAETVQRNGVLSGWSVLWLTGGLAGGQIGHQTLRLDGLSFNHAHGQMFHPADWTLLPLVLGALTVRLAFSGAFRLTPDLVENPWLQTMDLLISGVVAGVFLGRFHCFMRARRVLAASPSVRR